MSEVSRFRDVEISRRRAAKRQRKPIDDGSGAVAVFVLCAVIAIGMAIAATAVLA